MPLKIGADDVDKLYLGSTEILKAYQGSVLVWDKGAPPVDNDLVFTCETTGAGETFTLPFSSFGGGIYDCYIDWGDGSPIDHVTSHTDPALTHTYANAGVHEVRIEGQIKGIYFNNGGDRLKMRNISNWGSVIGSRLFSSFYGCSNMTVTASDSMDSVAMEFTENCFRGCAGIKGLIFSGMNFPNDASAARFLQDAGDGTGNLEINGCDIGGSGSSNYTEFCFGAKFQQIEIRNTKFGAGTFRSFLRSSQASSIDMRGSDISGVDDLGNFVWNSTSLTTLLVDGLDVRNVTEYGWFMRDCSALDTDLGTWVMTSMNSTANMFTGATSMSTANVDSFLAALYRDRMGFTWSTPSVDISPCQPPSGTYQYANPPTTGLEYVYWLENDPDTEGFNTWSITY